MKCRVAHNIPSAIKWTGSKRSQATTIAGLAPNYNRYLEPFMGSGAVMYLASHSGAIGNDIYQPLIDLWKLIRDTPNNLIECYTSEWNELNAELNEIEMLDISKMSKGKCLPNKYYEIRDRFNLNPNPIDLNFLMRTCVNGIVRFNNQGDFNNSFHLSRRGMKPEHFARNIRIWNLALQGVELTSMDYKQVLDLTEQGNYVYLDPPYAGTNQRYSKYVEPDELFDQLELLNSRKVCWALSYDGSRDDTDYSYNVPKELYKRCYKVRNGASAVKKVLAGPVEIVEESLYLNY